MSASFELGTGLETWDKGQPHDSKAWAAVHLDEVNDGLLQTMFSTNVGKRHFVLHFDSYDHPSLEGELQRLQLEKQRSGTPYAPISDASRERRWGSSISCDTRPLHARPGLASVSGWWPGTIESSYTTMRNLLTRLPGAAALLLLVASAPAQQDCDGCEDISTSITDTGPIVDPKFTVCVVSAMTRADGICESQSMAPPWSHVSECRELSSCEPRVTITVELFLSDPELYGSMRVDGGSVCGVSISYFGEASRANPLLVAPLIDQQIPVACGNLDCPIDVPVVVEIEEYDFFDMFWSFYYGGTINISGSLACTACDAVTQPPF